MAVQEARERSGRELQRVTERDGSRFASIYDYLRFMSVSHAPPASVLSRLGRMFVPYRLRAVAKAIGTAASVPASLLQARAAVKRGGELRLHLGSGPLRLPGWVNIDRFGSNANIFWDARWPLPFPADAAAAIFVEQMIEHLSQLEVYAFVRECHRVLRPGGVLRIGAEDFMRYTHSYLGDGRFIDAVRPGRPTRLMAFTELAYRNGHHSFWDAETLAAVFREAGLREVRERQFGESSLTPAPDQPQRQIDCFYLEGTK